MASKFDAVYERSINDPEGFWGEAAEALHWDRKWDQVLDQSNLPYVRWFVGGECNTCYNALDRHVENGRADQAALIEQLGGAEAILATENYDFTPPPADT